MRPRRPPQWRWVITSVFISSTLTVFIAWPIIPRFKQRVLLSQLVDPDLTQRQRALSYVIRHAADNPIVLRSAIEHLNVPDRTNFLQLVSALDRAGQWRRPTVPIDPWLRWITILGEDHSAEARIIAAQLTADLSDVASDPRLTGLLKYWLKDPQPDVRYNALSTVGELSGAVNNRRLYESLIASVTDDEEPEIARHAWFLLGFLDPVSGTIARWRGRPTEVASAILWAALRTHPQQPQPAIEALTDPSVELSIRAGAVYALSQSDSPAATRVLMDVIPSSIQQVNDQTQPLIWRAILGLRIDGDDPSDPARAGLERFLLSVTENDLQDPRARPVILCALYRLPRLGKTDLIEVMAQDMGSLLDQPMIPLAALEGLAGGCHPIEITDTTPDLLRWAAVASMIDPQPHDLKGLFASPRPAMRDLACVLAAQRFSPQQNQLLVTALLNDFNDDAKVSGAILAGLTGLEPKLLAKKQRYEDIWWVGQMMLLGMWMQGQALPQGIDMNELASGLLLRSDMPTTTILLAMLHQGRHERLAAIDYLLNPRGEERVPLVELFDQSRWWYVFERYLPPDAPPFWVWADPQLAQFQVDQLRDWYLLNRLRLRDLSVPRPTNGSHPPIPDPAPSGGGASR